MAPAIVTHLPSELKNLIASFCCPGGLAALALTDREFQAHAEPFLYACISVRTDDDRPGALATLVANPSKALLVKLFSLEIGKRRPRMDAPTKELFLQLAPRMKNLKDMRILVRTRIQETDFAKNLEDILCAQHFNLVQLYTIDCLDLIRVVDSQKNLKIIGIYSAVRGYHGPISLLSSRVNRSICVFGLAWLGFLPLYDSVTLFPDLMDSTQVQTFDTDIRKSFDMDTMRYKKVGLDHVTEVIVYLRRIPEGGRLNNIMKPLSKLFRNVKEVNFVLGSCEDLIDVERIEPVEWRCLTEVGIWCWDPRDDTGLERRNVSAAVSKSEFATYVGKWHQACPRLNYLQICNGWLASYVESGWTYKCN